MTTTQVDSDLGLAGRVGLVTGAGRGLGRTYAAALARQGARVVVHDAGVDQDGRNPNPAVAAAVAEELRAEGGSALTVLRAQGFGRIVLTTTGWALVPSEGSDRLVLYSHGKGAQFGLAKAPATRASSPT